MGFVLLLCTLLENYFILAFNFICLQLSKVISSFKKQILLDSMVIYPLLFLILHTNASSLSPPPPPGTFYSIPSLFISAADPGCIYWFYHISFNSLILCTFSRLTLLLLFKLFVLDTHLCFCFHFYWYSLLFKAEVIILYLLNGIL